ncbi:PilZ domain-containing protein [Desulfogranum marinum]|uniref:PilZ domain-containing protein n=1 Tax=Desulfogranum marinum TaxID=453220 RepID=UPI00196521E7|nr:PilZ domain-containing protein [Desulfogranum marinum]MBM9511892.1 PilZ domain-containing protein [Desulfogranum marinum]
MENYLQPMDRRTHDRYLINEGEDILVDFKGDTIKGVFTVRDLSEGGLAFFADGVKGDEMCKSVHIDLVFGNHDVIFRSLVSQIVFCCDPTRYGLKFLFLSNFEKRALRVFINKYCQ